jgi:hypothetical protein
LVAVVDVATDKDVLGNSSSQGVLLDLTELMEDGCFSELVVDGSCVVDVEIEYDCELALDGTSEEEEEVVLGCTSPLEVLLDSAELECVELIVDGRFEDVPLEDSSSHEVLLDFVWLVVDDTPAEVVLECSSVEVVVLDATDCVEDGTPEDDRLKVVESRDEVNEDEVLGCSSAELVLDFRVPLVDGSSEEVLLDSTELIVTEFFDVVRLYDVVEEVQGISDEAGDTPEKVVGKV